MKLETRIEIVRKKRFPFVAIRKRHYFTGKLHKFTWTHGEKATSMPNVVCLCGSTRFWRTFQQASLQETLAGKIVLSIGAASGTDDEHFGNLPQEEYDRVKGELDELHLRKIDMADEVLILNVGGYIGESTQRELDYALRHGKDVRFWEDVPL